MIDYCGCNGNVFRSDDAAAIRLEDAGLCWRVLTRPGVLVRRALRRWHCEWCRRPPAIEVRSDLDGWVDEEAPAPPPPPVPSRLRRLANAIPDTTFHWFILAVLVICLALGLFDYCTGGR